MTTDERAMAIKQAECILYKYCPNHSNKQECRSERCFIAHYVLAEIERTERLEAALKKISTYCDCTELCHCSEEMADKAKDALK